MSTISLALLTWNRASVFVQTMSKSLLNTGMPFDEIVWVDNGSEPSQYEQMAKFMAQFERVTHVRYPKNTGMSRGFNTGFCLSRSDYVVISGPDVFHPDNWAKIFYDYMEALPDAGVIAQYTQPITFVPERYRKSKDIEIVNGLPVLRAMPMDHYCIRRSIFQKVGYWREDFGLYGWSDVEWLLRCETILPKIGMTCYVIPDVYGHHLGSEGAYEFKPGNGDTTEYHAWKQAEVKKVQNTNLMRKCADEGYKYYSPF